MVNNKFYLHREAMGIPMPQTRPFLLTAGGTPLGLMYLGQQLGGENVLDSVSSIFPQQVMSIATTREGNTYYDFVTDVNSTNPSLSSMLIYPMTANYVTSSSYNSRIEISDIFLEPGREHTTWIKTWVTPPFHETKTLSTAASFSYDGLHFYGSSESASVYPRLVIYAWSKNNYMKDFLYDGTSTVTVPWYNPLGTESPFTSSLKTYWTGTPFQDTVIVEAGDKLCFELSQVEIPALDIATHLFAFDGTYSTVGLPYITIFHADSLSIENYVSRVLNYNYNIKNLLSNSTYLTYSVEGHIEKILTAAYDVGSASSFELNLSNPLRGHASLLIKPNPIYPATSPFFVELALKKRFYDMRFPAKLASLNKYEMIEDFEKYETLEDMETIGGWTFTEYDEDEHPYMEAKKVFAESKDLTNYSILSVLGRAARPNSLEVFFIDANDQTSSMNTILINTMSGRYECDADMLGCYPAIISAIVLKVHNMGDITIDDIVVLKQKDSDKYYEWTPIHLENVSLGKQSKISAVKIPYRVGETIQYHGEYSAKGQFGFRAFDDRETTFISEAERERTSLYLRAKQMGIPMEIESHEIIFTDYGSNSLKTTVAVDFREIYDSEV